MDSRELSRVLQDNKGRKMVNSLSSTHISEFPEIPSLFLKIFRQTTLKWNNKKSKRKKG